MEITGGCFCGALRYKALINPSLSAYAIVEIASSSAVQPFALLVPYHQQIFGLLTASQSCLGKSRILEMPETWHFATLVVHTYAHFQRTLLRMLRLFL